MLNKISNFVTFVMRDDRVFNAVRIDGISKEQLGYRENEIYFANEHGFVMFRDLTPTTKEVHIAMLKGAKNVDSFVYECLEKMRKQGAIKFVGTIGEWNKPALKLAKRCGFIEEGRISKAFLRDGQYHAMVIMGSK
jgi:RimJ/RimL family protein N-acetyltransferase